MFEALIIALACSCSPSPELVEGVHYAIHHPDRDPDIMLAIAWHESSFNPRAVGGVGEVGLWQLNPRYNWGKAAGEMCALMGAEHVLCLEEQGYWAWFVFERNMKWCGNVLGALSAYNAGACKHPKGRRYAARVMRKLKEVRRLRAAWEGSNEHRI